jgi:hypothetical protein
MSSAMRDRMARSRIREYLAQHGPIEDAGGAATALLKDAVDYTGNAVAFIQLVTAMDKAGEIKREIRGKRTYKIAAATAAAPLPARRGAAPAGEVSGGRPDIDYDELARALLREVWRVAGTGQPPDSLDEARLERDRLLAERDEYARQLDLVRKRLSTLIDESLLPGAAGQDAAASSAGPGQDHVERAS